MSCVDLNEIQQAKVPSRGLGNTWLLLTVTQFRIPNYMSRTPLSLVYTSPRPVTNPVSHSRFPETLNNGFKYFIFEGKDVFVS